MRFVRFSSLGGILGFSLVLATAGCNGRPTGDTEETAAVRDAVENQQYCPVMEGMEVNRDIYVDHEGKRVYFCCPGCIDAFTSNPEHYLTRLKERYAGDAAPTQDPSLGEDVHEGHEHHHGH